MTIVVRAAGRGRTPWELPPSRFRRKPLEIIKGGRRTLYELATAIAATGREVELRGSLDEAALEEVCEAAGARPVLDPAPRLPRPEDLIILPEGWPNPAFAPFVLGGARCVVMLLAPPGFAGWPFEPGPWEKPDPLTVDPASLGRPEQFRALAGLGFELWTHSRGLQAAAADAGVECAWIGSGQPKPFPPPVAKRADLVMLEHNRWASLAGEVAEQVGASLIRVPTSDYATVLTELGSARILVWPSRVEGHSRVQVEARAMGTVPVALASNRFAEGLGADGGAVLVDSLDAMAPAIRDLLSRPDELARLAARAGETAREQVDWGAYVARVNEVLSSPAPERPGAEARHEIASEMARESYRLRARLAAAKDGTTAAPKPSRRRWASRLRARRPGGGRTPAPRREPAPRPRRAIGSSPAVYVVGGYKPRGGGYVAYHVGRIAAERLGMECRVVSLRGETAADSRWDYPDEFESVSVGEMEAAIGPRDLLVANPSFSQYEFGLRVPGRKLMYVQGFGRQVIDGFFDTYVCASRFLGEMVRDLYGIEAPVIPPFIHLDRIPTGPDWDARAVGRILVMAKASGDRLLSHFHEVMRSSHPDVSYAVTAVDSLGHAELLERMATHRYFLTLSRREGFGLPPLEAMAAGCTVLGFHGGGGTEYMRPGENCEAVAYPAIEALCQRVATVLGDETTARRLAVAGRETAQGYGLEVFEDRWGALVEERYGGEDRPLR